MAVTQVVKRLQDVCGIVYVMPVFAVYTKVIVDAPLRAIDVYVVVISKQSVVKKDTGFVEVQNGTVEE